MKKNQILAVALALGCLLLSCKKEKQTSLINAEFSATSITKDGGLKVYTTGGSLVNDAHTIQTFTAGEQLLLTWDRTPTAEEKVRFVSADSVYLMMGNGIVYQRYAYKRQGSKIFFEETHEEMIQPGDGDLAQLYTNIVKYQPTVIETYSVPGIGGLNYYRRIKTVAVGEISQTDLKIYRFAFKYSKVNGDGYYRTNSGIPMNQFNEQFLKTLTAQSTLAIQGYVLNFKR